MLTLGLIARDEEEMLRRTLPVFARWFSRRLLLDTGSTDDTIAVARQHECVVRNFHWRHDFSTARNYALDLADMQREGAWMLQLDADEAMFPCDLIALERLCATVTEDVITLPRINLAARATLQEIGSYPDQQARCVRLGSSVRWELPVHEVIKAPQFYATGLHIYHYGWCKSPRSNWLRSHNYRMIEEGQPPLTEAPAWVCDDYDLWLAEMRQRHTFVEWKEAHPLRGLI